MSQSYGSHRHCQMLFWVLELDLGFGFKVASAIEIVVEKREMGIETVAGGGHSSKDAQDDREL